MGIFFVFMNQNLKKILNVLNASQADFAELIAEEVGRPIKQAHVWKWLNTTKNGIPAEYVIPAAKCVNFQVTPHELRPDLYPHPNDGLPSKLRADCSEAA